MMDGCKKEISDERYKHAFGGVVEDASTSQSTCTCESREGEAACQEEEEDAGSFFDVEFFGCVDGYVGGEYAVGHGEAHHGEGEWPSAKEEEVPHAYPRSA